MHFLKRYCFQKLCLLGAYFRLPSNTGRRDGDPFSFQLAGDFTSARLIIAHTLTTRVLRPRGYSQKNWVGVCEPPSKFVTLFQTKICENSAKIFMTRSKIRYPLIEGLTKKKSVVPCFRPNLSFVPRFRPGKHNLWRAFVDSLIDNDDYYTTKLVQRANN